MHPFVHSYLAIDKRLFKKHQMTANISVSSLSLVATVLAETRRLASLPDPLTCSGPLKFPRLLPNGEGRHLASSAAIDRAIQTYGDALVADDTALRRTLSRKEIEKLVRNAFGAALWQADLEQPDDSLLTEVNTQIRAAVRDRIAAMSRQVDHVFGVSFLNGPSDYAAALGPVRIDRCEAWLERFRDAGRIEPVTARRLSRRWSGQRVHKRKTYDWTEEAIGDAVGVSPFVCTVSTYGLSDEVGRTKSLLVARLAMTVVALFWKRPSSALELMRLLPDGTPYQRNTVSFNEKRLSGAHASAENLAHGQWVPQSWEADFTGAAALLRPIKTALTTYVDTRASDPRPRMSNALFSALWWFHEACREHAPLIATVKFAAALDALAGGGKNRGILELIEARFHIAPSATLMSSDNRTARNLITAVYDDTRSRMLHGSHQSFGDDYSDLRHIAEALGRRMIIQICEWMIDNPESSDDVKLWRK